jgi:hypothetical protein
VRGSTNPASAATAAAHGAGRDRPARDSDIRDSDIRDSDVRDGAARDSAARHRECSIVQMEIQFVVQDREGNRSAAVRQPVRLYPNRMCNLPVNRR